MVLYRNLDHQWIGILDPGSPGGLLNLVPLAGVEGQLVFSLDTINLGQGRGLQHFCLFLLDGDGAGNCVFIVFDIVCLLFCLALEMEFISGEQ